MEMREWVEVTDAPSDVASSRVATVSQDDGGLAWIETVESASNDPAMSLPMATSKTSRLVVSSLPGIERLAWVEEAVVPEACGALFADADAAAMDRDCPDEIWVSGRTPSSGHL